MKSVFASAATFCSSCATLEAPSSAELTREFADIARQEYEAVGIREALSPQADLATEPQTVSPGHRIAQLRIVERIQAVFEESDELAPAPRGESGFGSTGR